MRFHKLIRVLRFIVVFQVFNEIRVLMVLRDLLVIGVTSAPGVLGDLSILRIWSLDSWVSSGSTMRYTPFESLEKVFEFNSSLEPH